MARCFNMLGQSVLAVRMPVEHTIGVVVGIVASLWASFTFLRSSITGAPPLYSKGRLQRTLHFAAGIIFAGLAVGIGAMFVRR
jgi:hypothetical protein